MIDVRNLRAIADDLEGEADESAALIAEAADELDRLRRERDEARAARDGSLIREEWAVAIEKERAALRAEVETLTKENGVLADDCHRWRRKHETLRAEVERLMSAMCDECYRHVERLKRDHARAALAEEE